MTTSRLDDVVMIAHVVQNKIKVFTSFDSIVSLRCSPLAVCSWTDLAVFGNNCDMHPASCIYINKSGVQHIPLIGVLASGTKQLTLTPMRAEMSGEHEQA